MSYIPPPTQPQYGQQSGQPSVVVVTNPAPYGHGYGHGRFGYGTSTICSSCYPARHCLLVTGIIAAILSVVFFGLMIFAIVNTMGGSGAEMGDSDWFDKETSHSGKYFGMAVGCGFGMFVCFVLTCTCLPIAIMLMKRGQPTTTTGATTGASTYPAVPYNALSTGQPPPHSAPTNYSYPPQGSAMTVTDTGASTGLGQVTGYQYKPQGTNPHNKETEAMVQLPMPSANAPPPYNQQY